MSLLKLVGNAVQSCFIWSFASRGACIRLHTHSYRLSVWLIMYGICKASEVSFIIKIWPIKFTHIHGIVCVQLHISCSLVVIFMQFFYRWNLATFIVGKLTFNYVIVFYCQIIIFKSLYLQSDSPSLISICYTRTLYSIHHLYLIHHPYYSDF